MRDRLLAPTHHRGAAEVLDPVTGGAEGDETDQALYACRIVVLPELMALNRVSWPPLAADFAAPPGAAIHSSAEAVPVVA